jgi:hypothetical protein
MLSVRSYLVAAPSRAVWCDLLPQLAIWHVCFQMLAVHEANAWAWCAAAAVRPLITRTLRSSSCISTSPEQSRGCALGCLVQRPGSGRAEADYVTQMRSCDASGLELRGGEALRCELLVDASGRGSRLPEWLAAEGRPLQGLRREVVDSGLGYATRTIAMPPNWRRDQARRWPRECQRADELPRLCQPVAADLGTARLAREAIESMWGWRSAMCTLAVPVRSGATAPALGCSQVPVRTMRAGVQVSESATAALVSGPDRVRSRCAEWAEPGGGSGGWRTA